ncbi:MAG: hypothetical protein ACYCPD_06665 [Acidobacteriaceae bacterium]
MASKAKQGAKRQSHLRNAMIEPVGATASENADLLAATQTSPLVFISHDARDAELAEAFGKLLKSVSAGMIKAFRSSDKKGTDGIDFGDEWYRRLLTQLQATSDVVCLFTERSLDRPWILFEAGVAKSRLDTKVIGVALGVPLSRVAVGPFYQFMNMDDSAEDLTKLVNQLAQRVPTLELDKDVVQSQVAIFRATETDLLKKLTQGHTRPNVKDQADESAIAKLAEEMKALPSRVAERLADGADPSRRRRMRRFHPMMFEELLHMTGDPGDPIAILMAASVVREDAPWLYELAMEVYRTAKAGNLQAIEQEIERLRRFSSIAMRGPFAEEFGLVNKESYLFVREFPKMLEHILMRTLQEGTAHARRKTLKNQKELGE